MENISNTPSELLNLMLDGELPKHESEALYQNLADDPSLQSEMNDMMSIRQAVQNDTEAFTPPVESKSIIFERLGISNTDPVPVVPVAGATSTLYRYLLPTASALVASLLTTLVFVYYGNDDKVNTADKHSLKTTELTTNFKSAPIASVSSSIAENAVVNRVNEHSSNQVIDNKEKHQSTKNSLDEKIQVINSNDNESLNVMDNNTNVAESTTLVLLDQSAIQNMKELNPNQVFANSSSIFSKSNILNNLPNKENGSHVLILASGMTGNQDINSDPVSNISLGAYGVLPISISNFDLEMNYGVRIGNENFQTAVSPEIKGGTIEFHNQSVIFGVASTRLVLTELELFELISPYIQLEGGFTTHGAMTKEIAGIQISPDFKIMGLNATIFTSYEIGQLYQTNYSNTSTNKGVNFGFLIKF